MNFFKTLLHPDQEELEHAERVEVCQAANLLQVGEFQFLQLAYREWFGKDLPEALVSRLFTTYMLNNEVPHWARHYARVILMREANGSLIENDSRYHRYDHDYHTMVPRGVRRFCAAVGILAFLMVSGLLVAQMAADDQREAAQRVVPVTDEADVVSVQRAGVCFPPCVRDSELVPGRQPNGAGHP